MELKRTVLLIDDDKEEYELFCIALGNYSGNISCSHTYDCTASYDAVKGQHFDYIFLDFNLPVLNGFECLKKIKKSNSMKDAKVYMYSASIVDNSIQNLCLAFGAIKWITKPRDLKGYHKIFDEIFSEQSV
jgi:CheY-like chemotaxis protein